MVQEASVLKSKKSSKKKKSRERPKSEEKKREKTKTLSRSPATSTSSSSKVSPSVTRSANKSKSSVRSQSPQQQQNSKVNSSKRRSSASSKSSKKKKCSSAKSGPTKALVSAVTGKAYSPVAISNDVILRNQRQIDLIIYMLEGVRIEHVTKQNKDDLSKVQLLVKNITYREVGYWQRLRPVFFTEEQLEVFKVVLDEKTPNEGNAESSSSITLLKSKAKEERSPVHLTFPYKKLTFVPTVCSIVTKQGQQRQQKKKQAN